jgi:hypothetical protein
MDRYDAEALGGFGRARRVAIGRRMLEDDHRAVFR